MMEDIPIRDFHGIACNKTCPIYTSKFYTQVFKESKTLLRNLGYSKYNRIIRQTDDDLESDEFDILHNFYAYNGKRITLKTEVHRDAFDFEELQDGALDLMSPRVTSSFTPTALILLRLLSETDHQQELYYNILLSMEEIPPCFLQFLMMVAPRGHQTSDLKAFFNYTLANVCGDLDYKKLIFYYPFFIYAAMRDNDGKSQFMKNCCQILSTILDTTLPILKFDEYDRAPYFECLKYVGVIACFDAKLALKLIDIGSRNFETSTFEIIPVIRTAFDSVSLEIVKYLRTHVMYRNAVLPLLQAGFFNLEYEGGVSDLGDDEEFRRGLWHLAVLNKGIHKLNAMFEDKQSTSLQILSRRAFLRSFFVKGWENRCKAISSLPLPDKLVDYLNLSDFYEFTTIIAFEQPTNDSHRMYFASESSFSQWSDDSSSSMDDSI